MIRIILLGRTGNHLFQYALGRVLAEKHGVPLVLDGSWFNRDGWSEVSHFLRLPLKARVVRRFSLGTRALRKITGKHDWEYKGVPILREQPADQSFDPQFLKAPPDCLLFGYFQTPRYFESIAASLRAELLSLLVHRGMRGFGQDARATETRAAFSDQISSPASVAVHVRRGDYLIHPAFMVCDGLYYRNAMDRMRELVPGARFFIFSDDPGWCRNEFREADQQVLDSGPGGRNPLHDLHLMSLASHHIIANSTYSWWAAWLGNKAGQKVLMPDRWYSGDEIKAPLEEKRLAHWETIQRQNRHC